MGQVLHLRGDGITLPDVRGYGRALRASWHHEDGIAVLSLWRDSVCVGTVRLTPHEVAELVSVLVEGLATEATETGAEAPTTTLPAVPPSA